MKLAQFLLIFAIPCFAFAESAPEKVTGCALDRWAAKTEANDPLASIKALELLMPTPQNELTVVQTLQDYLKAPASKDPHELSMAYSWLGYALAGEVENVWNNAGKAESAMEIPAVDHAFQLEANNSVAYFARGFTLREYGFHYEALASYQKAEQLDPTCALPPFQAGNELVNLGQPKQAIPLLQKALKLDPSPAFAGKAYWIMGKAYFFAVDYPNTIVWLEKSVTARPNLWFNRLYLVAAYVLNHDMANAQKTLNAFNVLFPNYTVEKVIADEEVNPVDDPTTTAGRDALYKALADAGMPAK